MYSQLIYFIIVLLLFSLQPQQKAPADYFSYIPYIFIMFFLFAAYCRASFQKLYKSASSAIFISSVSQRYQRIQTRLNILAIAWLFFYIYVLNLNIILSALPGFDKFETISGLTGIALYLAHLCVIWFYAYPSYQAIHSSQMGRFDFIRGQLSFSVVILAPWFFISAALDLFQLIRMPAFFESELGQYLIVCAALVAFVLFGPWLMVRLWRCEPLPEGYVRGELEKFCDRYGFRVGGFLLWPLFGGEMLTAGVVGILPGMRYILITSGLLGILGVPELEAVVAHEMGHVRKKHLLFFLGLFILFSMAVYYLGDIVTAVALSNRTILNWTMAHDTGTYLVSSIPLLILVVVFFRYIFGFFLRNSERQADLFALQLLGNPFSLVSSFEKIAHHSGRIEDLPNWHHYSIRERIDFIMAASGDPGLIRKHNRKLYGAAIAYVAVFCALLLGMAGASRTGLARNLRTENSLALLEHALAQKPDDAKLQGLYGGLLFEKGRYSEAESVLSAALAMDPQNASVLNNLAWLYATSPKPYRNPSRALDLALRAVELSPQPNVLDTLAEAFYVNGRYKEAIAVINEAISMGGHDLDYLQKQKKRFERALQGHI